MNIDLRVISDFEHDAGLSVRFEARHARFEAIRPDRQVWQSILAVRVCGGQVRHIPAGLDHFDRCAGNNRARFVYYLACNLRVGHSLSANRRCEQKKNQQTKLDAS